MRSAYHQASSMDNSLNTDLLREYIRSFFGYGHVGARYWFIGLEEGGKADTLAQRVAIWKERGGKSFIDLRAISELGGTEWFGVNPPLQRTWRALMRLRFAAERLPSDVRALKSYQRTQLAASDGDTALLELLSLPVASRKEPWPHADTGLPELATRETYEARYSDERRRGLISLIETHAPPAVVTYGDAARWRKELGAAQPVNERAWTGRFHRSLVVCTHHPEGARSNAHWAAIGTFLANNLSP